MYLHITVLNANVYKSFACKVDTDLKTGIFPSSSDHITVGMVVSTKFESSGQGEVARNLDRSIPVPAVHQVILSPTI